MSGEGCHRDRRLTVFDDMDGGGASLAHPLCQPARSHYHRVDTLSERRAVAQKVRSYSEPAKGM